MDKLAEKVNKMSESELRKYAETEKLEVLHPFKLYLDDLYYNTEASEIDDWRYDIIKDILKRRDPNYIPPIGAKIRNSKNRAELPVWMGSMDKISCQETTEAQKWASDIYEQHLSSTAFLYRHNNVFMVNKKAAEFKVPDFIKKMFKSDDTFKLPLEAKQDPSKEIEKWLSENPAKMYNISSKLDGVSCLVVCRKGTDKIKLYTRGDGIVGSDISYVAQYINTLPKTFPRDVTVRAELVIPVEKFNATHKNKYKNPRNMVTGLIGAKTVRKGMKDIDLVVYEEIASSSPSKQFKNLTELGFKVVKNEKIDLITVDSLMETYIRFRQAEEYEIDGLIVQSDIPHSRNTDGNPSYAFAFKMMLSDNVVQTKVIEVDWNVSKWGKIIPRVFIEPVELSGVTVTKATAFNAKYVVDNSIGKGTVIDITRSGEVIPFIVRIVKKSKEPDMPTIPYTWDETHVNIISEEKGSDICVKMVHSFFNKMKILQVGEKRVEKMYNAGFNSLLLIIEATEEDLVKKGKFGKKTAKIIVTNIHEGLQNVLVTDLIGSAGILGYGMGRKRVTELFKAFPDILTAYKKMTNEELTKRIMNVEGFSDKMASVVAANIQFADAFVKNISKYATFKKAEKKVEIASGNLIGKKYLLTGFRDAALIEDIKKRGGTVMNSLSGKTNGVIIKEGGGKTGKPDKARSMGIPVYTVAEFKSQILTN